MKKLILGFLLLSACKTASDIKKESLMFVGTYTVKMGHVNGKASGIYTCRLNTENGALTIIDSAVGITNPSFLTISPNKKWLFAVAESGSSTEKGKVVAYRIRTGGHLEKINEQLSYGFAPCHISTDKAGKYVFVANYVTGNVASYSIAENGALSDSISMIKHSGAQTWAHNIIQTPHPNTILGVDKGADKVYLYNLSEKGALSLKDSVSTEGGAGPRHFAFAPNGKYGFVVNELSNTVNLCGFDAEKGQLSLIGKAVSTLPTDFKGQNTCADIHVHPNGRFVYASNRGHNSIAIFAFDEGQKSLVCIGQQSTNGAIPRNFYISDDGKLLLAANQNTDNVVAFYIDAQTGKLTPTGQLSYIPTPVCLQKF